MKNKITWLLLNRLTSGSVATSMEQLLEYLKDNDIDRTDRTLYRLFNELRECGIDIVWSTEQSRYILSEDTLAGNTLKNYLKMLEHFVTMELITKNLKNHSQLLSYIDYEHQQLGFGSIANFRELLLAMEKQVNVQFLYKSFEKETENEYLVSPLYLKQFQNRWYLIAEHQSKFKSFGLDRMPKVKLLSQTFTAQQSKIEKAKMCYAEIVGINYSNTKQRLVLEFDLSQKPYLESLPLHSSQTEIQSTNPGKYTIELWVRPNYELQQQIQKYGNKVTVTQGDWICL